MGVVSDVLREGASAKGRISTLFFLDCKWKGQIGARGKRGERVRGGLLELRFYMGVYGRRNGVEGDLA